MARVNNKSLAKNKTNVYIGFFKGICLISLTSVLLHLNFIGLLLLNSVYIVEKFFNLGIFITCISFIIFILSYLKIDNLNKDDEEEWEEFEEYN